MATELYDPHILTFKRKRLALELRRGAPTGSFIKISDDGYINSELIVKCFKHFHSVVRSSEDKPVLLLLDGHSIHRRLQTLHVDLIFTFFNYQAILEKFQNYFVQGKG